jgi:hypothetical protein
MNEVNHWHNALGELKNAFKDESTMSNVAVSNLIVEEEDFEALENIDDQVSFHSTDVIDIDKYKVEQHVPDGYKDVAGQPGMLDVTDDQEPLRYDAAAELSNLSNMIKLDLTKMKNMENGTFQINIDDEESIKSELQSSNSGSGSDSGSHSSHSNGSLLFNAWNEDYEGNPDPEVLKRLLHARSLPRSLDPYIKTQIKRAKIIQKLQELEDDVSSKGSCEMMFDVVCGPRFCGNDSDAGTADTNSLVLSLKEDDSFASLDTRDFMFRKPQKSPLKYSLTPDKKYKPAEVQSSFTFGSGTHDKAVPIQKLTPPPFVKDDTSEGTYEEKEMEFTLQHFEGLLGNCIPTEINVPSDDSDEVSTNSHEMENDYTDEDDNLDLVALKMKRINEDDDSVLDDRSVMSPSEAAQYASYMRTRLIQLTEDISVHKDMELEYFLQLFSNPDYKAPTMNNDGDIYQLPETVNTPEDAIPPIVINGVQTDMDTKISSIASTFDASLNPIEGAEYGTVPTVVKPSNQPKRFISELSCPSDVQELSTCSDQELVKAAPLIESASTLLSSDSFVTNNRETDYTKDDEELSESSEKYTIENDNSKDSVDLLMDALDLNLQTTTTFPSSEGEEFVFGLPVDGIVVDAPQSKFGRIISPKEFAALQTISESRSFDGNIVKENATHDDLNETENNVIDTSSIQETSHDKEKISKTVDTVISYEVKPFVLSPSSTSLNNKLGEIVKEFKEISEELDQIERDEVESNSSIPNKILMKPTLTSPRANKPTPLSPRNLQAGDSCSTVSNDKMQDDLNDLKSSISKRRGASFGFSTVES